MARPFDDSLPYQHLGGSMSSQTSLAGGRVWRSQTEGASKLSPAHAGPGSSWNSSRPATTSKIVQGPKLPKIKSSPSHGALAAARVSHAKLHRRGNSAASSTQSPTSPTFVPDFLLKTASPNIPASAHADPYVTSESKSGTKSKAKIKPLLRKFSSQEKVAAKVDLSRSVAENEGLGIYTSSDFDGSQFGPDVRRGYHNRTVSGTSQISTMTTASNRYGSQYVHPMRQTSGPYTPPVPSSFKTSLESEAPTITSTSDLPHFETHSRTASSNTDAIPASYAPIPSSRRPPPLHIRTGSSSRLTSSSQTNLPGTPSSLRFNTDTITPADMISPTARSSFDSKLFKRSRSNTANTTNTTNDPLSQQATVQALRQKFQEKEAAKDRKYQEAEARAQEKEAKRQERREEQERRTSEKRERKRTKSNAASEKSSFVSPGEQSEGFPAVHLHPPEVPMLTDPPQRRRGDTTGSAGKAVRGQWSLFWFRFKTMWLRIKKKMSR